ncbi:hypothetical protein [Sphingomonas sp.]|uniref:hypothetical protein n=1 Tax=Sphingomonas sp. TaxID=28214 RepID=UPI0028A7408B|nr:hypothetical protein [Sphingomonas sp.]
MGGTTEHLPQRAGPSASTFGLLLALAVPFFLLAGCKTPKLLCFSSSGLQQLTITSSTESNLGRPIAVDLVYVTDRKILAAVEKMKAREYFAVRTQLSRDYPKGLLVRSWELQAGQQVVADPVRAPCNLVGTFLFANFGGEAPADNRLRLHKVRRGTLALGADGFTWVPDKG